MTTQPTATNPRVVGRPKPKIPPVRVNLILDAETIEKLIKHGKGNMSLAVRLLVANMPTSRGTEHPQFTGISTYSQAMREATERRNQDYREAMEKRATDLREATAKATGTPLKAR